MRFEQTGKIGILIDANQLRIENKINTVQQEDPSNPVAIGYSTQLTIATPGMWTIDSNSVHKSGVAPINTTIDIPVGNYEIEIDTYL